MSSRAYNRRMTWKHAVRKKKLSETHYWNREHPYYDNLHQYSKNKIHCSCAGCSKKTRNKGHKRYRDRGYSKAINYKANDMRKMNAMDFDEFDTLGIPISRRKTAQW